MATTEQDKFKAALDELTLAVAEAINGIQRGFVEDGLNQLRDANMKAREAMAPPEGWEVIPDSENWFKRE